MKTPSHPQTAWLAIASAVVFFALTSVAPTRAALVFDGGAPDQANGNEVTRWAQAEDFALPASTAVASVRFWTLEGSGGSVWDGTLQYLIFADAGGVPAATPLVTGVGQAIARTQLGPGPYGLTEFEYQFTLQTPFSATGGTTYWLALHLASDYANRDEIYWETTNLGSGAYGSTGEESLGGTFNNWFDNNQYHAFELYGGGTRLAAPTLSVAGFALVVGLLFGVGSLALRRMPAA